MSKMLPLIPKSKILAKLIYLIIGVLYICFEIRADEQNFCGRPLRKSNLQNAAKRDIPWVAAVLQATGVFNQPFKFITTGTIVGRQTILAVFTPGNGGLFKLDNTTEMFGAETRIRNVKDLVVYLGQELEDGTISVFRKEAGSALYFVKYVTAHNEQRAGGDGDVFQMVMLHVDKLFRVNEVSPLCFDPAIEVYHDGSGVIRQFTAEGYSETGVTEARENSNSAYVIKAGVEKVHLRNHNECFVALLFREISEPDLLCGVLREDDGSVQNGTTKWHSDVGTALVLRDEDGTAFLGGVAVITESVRGEAERSIYFSNFVRKPTAENQDFNLSYRKQRTSWISANIKCENNGFLCTSGKCIPLSRLCDHRADCVGAGSNLDDEDPRVCDAINQCEASKPIWCGFGDACVHSSQICDGFQDCENGWDESDYHGCKKVIEAHVKPSGGKTCPIGSVHFPNTILTCNLNGRNVSCENPVPGTEVHAECAPFYVPWSVKRSSKWKCKEDGEWSSLKYLTCEPECGRLSRRGVTAFIAGGNSVDSDHSFPWYVGIYVRRGRGYKYQCAGTLIDERFVVTAAHCVTTNSGVPLSSYNRFKLVLGGKFSSFGRNKALPGVILADIERAWVPHTYSPRDYTSDVGLIQLKKPIVFQENVRPICFLNSRNERSSLKGQYGLVAGLGMDQTGTNPWKLQWGKFQHVNVSTCRSILDVHLHHNEFCARFENETAICPGDSGGSFVGKMDEYNELSPYALKGIVSRGIEGKNKTCLLDGGAVIVDVEPFFLWILRVLEMF